MCRNEGHTGMNCSESYGKRMLVSSLKAVVSSRFTTARLLLELNCNNLAILTECFQIRLQEEIRRADLLEIQIGFC